MLKILKPISLIIFCSAIIHLVIFFFVNAHAGEPEAAGFSGHIMVGGAFYNITEHWNTNFRRNATAGLINGLNTSAPAYRFNPS